MDVRESIQEQAKQAWLASNGKATIVLPTGSGKSLVAIRLIKELQPRNILLLTNSELLRDVNWKAEFNKFGLSERWGDIDSQCYQTVYKEEWRQGKEYDLIIYDEVDFAVSPEYQSVFIIPSEFKLAMTGFITDEKREILKELLPIVFEAKTQDLQEEGLLNKSEFIFIEYPISKEKNLEQKTKKGLTFKVSENDQYKYYDKQFQQAMIVKSGLDKKYRFAQINAEIQEDWKAADWRFKIMATKRKSILNNLASSITVTKNIIEHIHKNPNNKIIVYSALTKQADQLPNPYHGKSEKDNKVLEDLNAGTIKTASVIKKINRGMNLVGVNYLIYESFDGGETEFTQKHGRGLRLRPDQTLKVIILIPLYEDLVKVTNGSFQKHILDTQASKWAQKMMVGFDTTSSRIIRLDSTLKIKDGINL